MTPTFDTRVLEYEPEAQWMYKGQLAMPDGCEVDEVTRTVTVLYFRLAGSGARVRAELDPDTDTFEDVVYHVPVH